MESVFEQMGGTYRQEGDYLLPNLVLTDTTPYLIGKYGRLRRAYLKEHHPGQYSAMSLNGTLHQHLSEIDRTCSERVDFLICQMAKREGVTEELKASSQLGWVGRMNNIRNRAEEIVLNEIIYE